ncbi:hypothetical protein FH609_006970 [Streptomyces sp. 3MP-14]|uniref:Uncharacterized protein n=1 Tax=Streptomyces mimosae TaxID=2586635 RepID=A0A5N6AKV2_9ACTN|nr:MULTISPECIES: hypothetical protein [Streptomyces]KAB8168845.1 hypothetical protein FH607_006395 [Streptomyces mimosae]KAB8177875.1 hypothetical protein FH609_006970 [Streptomyces sp. 3MP-14]
MSQSDLYLDYERLRENRDTIRNIAGIMEQPCRAMAEVDGSSMGVALLVGRMDDFGEEWEYEISQLAEFAEAAADGLDEILRSFQSIDDELSRAVPEPARAVESGPPAS